MDDKIKWASVIGFLVILLGGLTVYVFDSGFEIQLADGGVKAKYNSGVLKVYSGRNLAWSDSITPYYYNGKGYTKMYKARGTKYSEMFVSNETEGVVYLKQTVYYSRGNLTRYFVISEYDIKSSFEWVPTDPGLRTYFNWQYKDMDELKEKIVYVDRSNKESFAVVDFGNIITWHKDLDKIVRVERFKNGNLNIRTVTNTGAFSFDPEIILDSSKSRTFLTEEIVGNKKVTSYSSLSVETDNQINCRLQDFKEPRVCEIIIEYDNSLKEMSSDVFGMEGSVDKILKIERLNKVVEEWGETVLGSCVDGEIVCEKVVNEFFNHEINCSDVVVEEEYCWVVTNEDTCFVDVFNKVTNETDTVEYDCSWVSEECDMRDLGKKETFCFGAMDSWVIEECVQKESVCEPNTVTEHSMEHFEVIKLVKLNEVIIPTGESFYKVYFTQKEEKNGFINLTYGNIKQDPPTVVSNCSSLSGNTEYVMNQSVSVTITGASTPCFSTTGDNIVLDCAGHSIINSDGINGWGVFPTNNNFTVKNCANISGWDIGVHLGNTDNDYITVENCTIENTDRTSIYGDAAGSHLTIRDNTISGIDESIFLGKCGQAQTDCNYYNNIITGMVFINKYGGNFYNNTFIDAELRNSEGVNVYDNTWDGGANGDAFMIFGGSDNMHIYNNSFTGTATRGVLIYSGANHNIFEDNNFTNVVGDGITTHTSLVINTDNTIRNNIFDNVSVSSVSVHTDDQDGTIEGNTFTDCGTYCIVTDLNEGDYFDVLNNEFTGTVGTYAAYMRGTNLNFTDNSINISVDGASDVGVFATGANATIDCGFKTLRNNVTNKGKAMYITGADSVVTNCIPVSWYYGGDLRGNNLEVYNNNYTATYGAYAFYSIGGSDMYIHNNYFSTYGGLSGAFLGGTNANFTNNTFLGSFANGAGTKIGGTNVNVNNNNFNCSGAAQCVYSVGSVNSIVEDNTWVSGDTTSRCTYTSASTNLTIRNNNMSSPSHFLDVVGADKGLMFVNNTCNAVGLVANGVELRSATITDVTIANNSFLNVHWGIDVDRDITGVTIDGNTFSNCQDFCIHTDQNEGNDFTVTNNIMSSLNTAADYDMVVSGDGWLIENNTFLSNRNIYWWDYPNSVLLSHNDFGNGIMGDAVVFDGDGYVNMTSSFTELDSASHMSMSAWVYGNSVSQYNSVVARVSSDGARRWGMIMAPDLDDVFLLVRDNDGSSCYTTSDCFKTGEWNHWTMVFNGSGSNNTEKIKFYHNGVNQALTCAATVPTTLHNGTTYASKTVIGDYRPEDGAAYKWHGSIDEVAIWNRSLSASEALDIYNNGLNKEDINVTSDRLVYYHLDADETDEEGLYNGDLNGGYYGYYIEDHGCTDCVYNSPTEKYGGASMLGGTSSYINFASPSIGDTQTSMSINMWVRPSDDYTSASGMIYLFAHWWGPYIIYDHLDGQLSYLVYNSTDDQQIANTTMTLDKGVWYNIVGVHNTTHIMLYVDGVLKDTQAASMATPKTGTAATYLGADWDGVGYHFDGGMSEVTVYNRTLSTAEIVSNRNRVLQNLALNVTDNLMHYWPLNNSDLTDHSGSLDGTGKYVYEGFYFDLPWSDNLSLTTAGTHEGNNWSQAYVWDSTKLTDTNSNGYADSGTNRPYNCSYTKWYNSTANCDGDWYPATCNVQTDTCTCAGLDTNWEIDNSDYCNITDDCNLGVGFLNFTGAGITRCNSSINTTNLGDPGAVNGSDGKLEILNNCYIRVFN